MKLFTFRNYQIRLLISLYLIMLLNVSACKNNSREDTTVVTEQGDKEELSNSAKTFPAKSYRYIICTDMTHDDDNSFIRLLHYANEIDIEAIIVTEQGPETDQIENWPEKMWARAQQIIDAYSQVEDNLRLHDPNFPTAEYIRSITKKGKGSAERMTGSSDDGDERFWDYVGEGWDSDGSKFLQQAFDKEDERPIYVGFWGGPITFAQAMWRYQQKHTEAEVQALLDKMIFHCISFQDVTFDMFVDLDAIGKNIGTNKPFYGDYDGERLIPKVLLADGNNFWSYIGAIDEEKVYEYSGPLGDLYDKGGEGDTPAFLNLVSMNLGLSDIAEPEYGGWGDMFEPYGLKNVWVADHNKRKELMKWLPQTSNDFYARCLWEENSPDATNHAPIAAFNGDFSHKFVKLTAGKGETIRLNAEGPSDPDGDELSYQWWQYQEADSYEGEITIENSNSKEASFVFPDDVKEKEIHVILEVQDNGEPALTSYKRIIITKNR